MNDAIRHQWFGLPLPCPRDELHDWQDTAMRSGSAVTYECTRCGLEEERDRS